MAHSSHRRWKGCPLCKPQKDKRYGRTMRDPWPVRRAVGRNRRLHRGYIGDDQN